MSGFITFYTKYTFSTKIYDRKNNTKNNTSTGRFTVCPRFFSKKTADANFNNLRNTIPWEQGEITVFGKNYPEPRLKAWFATNKKSYTYSGTTMQPYPFSPILNFFNEKLEKLTGVHFTTCLANLYRDGSDSNGWHADDEKGLGSNPIIASISLGQARRFKLRYNNDHSLKYDLLLDHGSLLLMQGTTQHFWKHQLPKTKRKIGERINLTFRII